ncbi:siderophore-interacting protein [Hydrogenophaga sp.]|uniref:siderophore-interacting protein n=1 Tax=Hydrogenophaga sp. TaxID=1904254 RepID=UPI0035696995
MTTPDTLDPLAVQRLRHPLQFRRVRVLQVHRPSPHLVRIRFAGEALRGFVSASFDDHFKLALPTEPDGELPLPTPGPDGLQWPEHAPRPVLRDYTPQRFDSAQGWLDVEFALHGDGFAAQWAAQARVGQEAGVGGPRGSFVVPTGFDWHLLVGDETALPAIARRLEELPAGTQALVIAETADPADRRVLPSRANLQLRWLTEVQDGGLAQAVRELRLPPGEGYAWVAGESLVVATTRRVLVEQHGLAKERLRASAYWKRGASAHHETL